jgi:outer membrane protein
MKHWIAITVFVWIAGMAVQGGAVESPPWSLDDCLRLGLENSIPLANARRDIAIAESGIRQTRAQVLPHLDLNSSYTRLDEVSTFAIDTESIPMGKRDNYSVNTELSQLLYNGGQINAALRAARDYRRFAAWQKATVEADLRLRISEGFHDLLFAQAAVTVAEENIVQLRALLKQAEARWQMQVASEFDVLSARVRLANAIPPLIATSNRLHLARISLANLVCPDSPDLQIAGELRVPPESRPLAEFLVLGARHRPELQQMQSQLQLREEDLQAERGTLFPEIKAFADYTGNNPPQFSAASSEWDWQWSAGIRASWPLFDGGLSRARILEKSLELEKTRDALEDFKRAVALEIRQAFLDLGRARETITAEQETQALADRALAIAGDRYREGLATVLEVSESNLARNQARLTLLNAHREECNALARLLRAAGLTVSPPEEP